MDGIVDIQLGQLIGRLAQRNISLFLDLPAKKWLADQGYDPVFGARPLKRVIQSALQNQLAEMLLSGDLSDGDVIPVTARSEGLIVGDRISSSMETPPVNAVVH